MLICWFHAFRFLGVFGPQAGEALAKFFWKSSKLNKEFSEPIPRPPSGQESPQNWVLRYVVVKHAFFVFFDAHAHLLNMVSSSSSCLCVCVCVCCHKKFFSENIIKSCMFKSVCAILRIFFKKINFEKNLTLEIFLTSILIILILIFHILDFDFEYFQLHYLLYCTLSQTGHMDDI